MPGGIHPPVSWLATWPTPNYKDPPTRGKAEVILTIVLGILSVATVATRLYARARVQNNFGVDDWIIIVAMIPTLGMAVGMCLATQAYGFDRHVWDIAPAGWITARKIEFANELLYLWASGLIKISILFFYRRMTAGTFSKTFVYVIWAAMAFVVGYMIAFSFDLIFLCTSVDQYWLQVSINEVFNPHDYHCTDEAAAILAGSGVSLAQDVIAATLPLALFGRLEIPRRQKIALIGVFSVGFFLVVCNAVRMYYVWKVFYETWDSTWYAYDIWVWTTVEILVAPICASAPALKVFFRGVLQDRTWGTWSSTKRSASRGWQRTGDDTIANEEGLEKAYIAEAKDSFGNSLRHSTEQVGRPLDSPTLGTESSKAVEMDYFKTVRDSETVEIPQTSTAVRPSPASPSPALPRESTKVERTLGL